MEYYVIIKEFNKEEEVKRMGPMDERKASKVEAGVSINLNHEHYYTVIEEASDA